jgi:general secretion pathway protein D
MIVFNNLRSLTVFAAIVILLPVPTVDANNRKGDKFMKLGEAAEARKDYDAALEFYTKALGTDPKEVVYQLATRRVRFEASQAHVEAGMKLRQAGKLDQALVEFQKAFSIDPGSTVALQEIKHTTDALDQIKKGNVPPGETPLTPAEQSRVDSVKMIESMLPVPVLRPITSQISSLKMNNQPPKVLYETVGKLAGINVLFDPQMQAGRPVNLDLTNTTLDEALDYIGLLTKTFWKPVSANAIFVTEDNVTKRRDYEDEVVKVFYLRNPTSVQEFQEIITAVRSVTDVRRMFTFNAQNAVMVRDTVDKVALVEKLLHDMDKPKSEVMVDVIVMEVNSDKSRSIASALVSGGTTGLALPISFTPRTSIALPTSSTTTGTGTTGTTGVTGVTGVTGTTGTTTTGTTTTNGAVGLNQLSHISTADFSTTLPGALLQAVMSDTSTKVMQSPQVRASDGQKVSLKIGDKYPYATGSFQPGIGTVGVSPLVSTQFQFVDTGVNVELTPHVHGNDEVTLHILVDISQVSSTVNLGGLSQPVISQRKNEADIRLRDGEVSLVGGLTQTSDSNSTQGIPGLTSIPILGKYFLGSNSKDKMRDELMIALIPHILRTPDISGLDLRGVAAGTDQVVKLNFAPRKEEAAPNPAPPSTAPTAPAPTATAPAGPAPATPAPPPGAPSVTPVAPTSPPRLSFSPTPIQVALSAPVVVSLQADNITDLGSAPVKIKWDPKILRLNQAAPGSLLGQPASVNAPTLDIRNDAGEATIEMSRRAGAGGVTGSGPILQLTFMAIGKGSTTITVTEASLKDSKQQPITLAAPSVTVTVQ